MHILIYFNKIGYVDVFLNDIMYDFVHKILNKNLTSTCSTFAIAKLAESNDPFMTEVSLFSKFLSFCDWNFLYSIPNLIIKQ